MKHNFYFFITIFIVVNSCTAMELPLSSQEKYALFLDNNSILIHGKDSCRITNIHTQQNSAQLDNLAEGILYMHPNKKHFALSERGKIRVYETKNGKECTWFCRGYFDRLPIYFNPSSEKDFFAWQEVGLTAVLRQYDCTNHIQDTTETGITNIWNTGKPAMDIHPTQQKICVQDEKIYFYEYNEKDKRFIKFQTIKNSKPLSLIKYSPEGSLIACMDSKSIDIINDNHESSSFYELKGAQNAIFSLEFHPNNSVLAILYVMPKENINKTLLKPEDFNLILQYHDIEQKNIIANISLSDLYPSCIVETMRALSFAPDGRKLGIILKDKYIILPVPLEVICTSEAKKLLLYFLFVLKNYEIKLPAELINLIANISLETYKRS